MRKITGNGGLCLLPLPKTRLAFLRREAAAAVPYCVGLHLAALQHERLRLSALACSNSLHRAAGRDGGVVLIQDCCPAGGHGELVAVLDQEPVCALATFPIVGHAN